MKKLSLTARRLAMAGIVVGLAGVVVALILRQAEGPASSADKSTVASATASKDRRLAAPNIALPGEQAPADPPPLMDDDEVLESIVQKDPKLKSFMTYYKAVLPSDQTRDEYHKLLSDPAMMTAMATDLMDPGTGHPRPEEYYRRLMLVDYFDAALSWKDNPERQKLLGLTKDIILKDNFGADQDGARRQALGGTKMELYRLLYAQDAQNAAQLLAMAKGTRMEPLVNWMAEEDLRRRTREQEILKEGDQLVRSN